MPWQDELKELRANIEGEGGYLDQMAEVAERRRLLERFAVEMEAESLLTQMNAVLLDGGGRIIISRSWEYEFSDDDDDDDDGDEANEIRYILYWHDGEPMELEVRVGIDEEYDGYVLVGIDGVEEDDEVEDPSVAGIQEALLDAFRDIIDLDDDDD